MLDYTLNGKNIAEVLGMSVAEARDFFGSGAAHAILDRMADVEQMLALVDRLVEAGKTVIVIVIVIEHHRAMMAHADWIIDIGAGAGQDGGRIVFDGTQAALIADGSTRTGQHLELYVGR